MRTGGCIYVYELYDKEELRNEKNIMATFYLQTLLVCNGAERNNQRWRDIGEKVGLKVEFEVIPNHFFLKFVLQKRIQQIAIIVIWNKICCS
ncbi:hypothetical protein PPL_06572 [Heterostelium album PN500]|uniref:Uncharacterized protein n=1 Tax=Heterostelium pallidum (strain ATCC 26659 / Pp 5 / PN500) TaxID=670386 RepID=D3BDI9_HETP5|nr:hypothetical protein PPL_06572 [Heterostelium album PN500]EFA80534.1 hypothetical protein PPL_06572 [Heterostelium album PN500]|eukprot:XP_020432654.1 hypothetical protein PPL_06572 [Heterostelium album PN500]